jgi:hypothetical protein
MQFRSGNEGGQRRSTVRRHNLVAATEAFGIMAGLVWPGQSAPLRFH